MLQNIKLKVFYLKQVENIYNQPICSIIKIRFFTKTLSPF